MPGSLSSRSHPASPVVSARSVAPAGNPGGPPAPPQGPGLGMPGRWQVRGMVAQTQGCVPRGWGYRALRRFLGKEARLAVREPWPLLPGRALRALCAPPPSPCRTQQFTGASRTMLGLSPFCRTLPSPHGPQNKTQLPCHHTEALLLTLAQPSHFYKWSIPHHPQVPGSRTFPLPFSPPGFALPGPFL